MKISPYYDEIKARAIEILRSGKIRIEDGDTFERLIGKGWGANECIRIALYQAVADVARLRDCSFTDGNFKKLKTELERHYRHERQW